MKLSKREKIMVAGLVVVASAYFAYSKIYSPKIEQFQVQRKSLEWNIKKKSQLSAAILDKDRLMDRVNAMKLVSDELGRSLPKTIYQENVILYINDVFSRNRIRIISSNYSGYTKGNANAGSINGDLDEYIESLEKNRKMTVKEYVDEKKAENEAGEEEKEQAKDYESMAVEISFLGEYADIKNAISEIEQSRRKIIIKSISMNNTALNIAGTMSLEFPSYPEGTEGENEDWNIVSQYGNTEPFLTGRLSILNAAVQSTQSMSDMPKQESSPSVSFDSDFYTVLKPISSDMPTVTMGKSPYRYTAIYEDSNAFKEASLYIKKEGGKYLYRYETSSSSYPAGSGEYEQMKPFGSDVVMKVYSTARLNEKDLSGLVLNIYNDTGKSMYVYVHSDDASNPRFKPVVKKGTVYTERY